MLGKDGKNTLMLMTDMLDINIRVKICGTVFLFKNILFNQNYLISLETIKY